MTDSQSIKGAIWLSEKKERLMDAAVKLILENGFEKTSVSQIVREAGVAQGTFYLYFESKNEIVPNIAEKIIDKLLNRLKSSFASGDTLDCFIDTMVESSFAITEEHRELISFCYSGFAYYNSFERWEEVYKPYYDWIKMVLSDFRELGKVQLESDIDYLSKYIVGLLEQGAELHYLFKGTAESSERSKQELRIFLRRALKGE